MTEDEFPEEDVDTAAALWHERLRVPNVAPEVFADFRRWLARDTRHGEAFDRVGTAWDDFVDHALATEILGFRQDALKHAQQLRGPGTSRRWAYGVAAWFILFSAGATGLFYYLNQPKSLTYSTELGQREHLILADHSQVDVDADSTILVRFDGNTRHIEVLRGQAYFQVAKDPKRKFVVENRGHAVIATGTEFDVEALPDQTRVTLVEGHVLVGTPGDNGHLTRQLAALEPGDSLRIGVDNRTVLRHRANVLALTAWRHGKLVFDDTPVSEAVAEMARYTHEAILLGPGVETIRVSGVFAEGDLEGFVSALESYYPVRLEREATGQLKLVRR